MNGKSILITGCSSGIGLETALTLQKRGYRVFAAARKAADIVKLQAAGLESVQLDVNDSTSITQALASILEKTGGTLDALFNNAGIMQAGAIEDLSREMNRAQFETNVFGPMELVKAVLPIMRNQGHGRILQNSSILGVITLPYYGAYNASKFALEGFSNTLRQELRDTNIHVSIINPGPITTALRNNALEIFQHSVAKDDTSAHQPKYKALETAYFKPSKRDLLLTLTPDAVVKKVIHALESNRPKAHYFIGIPAQCMAVLRRLLPDRALDWVLTKVN